MAKDVYTLPEIADKLDVSIRTLRDYIKSGRIAAIKVGNKYVVSVKNYEKFINGEEKGNR